jgi:hypothetical protein
VNSLSSPFERIFLELEFPNPIPEYRGGEWTDDYNNTIVFPSERGAHEMTLPKDALDYSQLYQLPSMDPRQPFSPSCLLEQNQVPLTQLLNSYPGEKQTFDIQRHPTQNPTLSSVIDRAFKNVSNDGNHTSSITSTPSTHRELRPKRQRDSIEDSLVNNTAGDSSQLPRKAKKLKGSTCVSCRLARVNCGKVRTVTTSLLSSVYRLKQYVNRTRTIPNVGVASATSMSQDWHQDQDYWKPLSCQK